MSEELEFMGNVLVELKTKIVKQNQLLINNYYAKTGSLLRQPVKFQKL